MTLKKTVAYFNTTAYGHRAEDAWAVDQFTHDGADIVVGCVSDGCSGDIDDEDYQPELGAAWLSRQFTTIAKALYIQGLRGEELGKTVVLRLGVAMRDYKPQSSRSKWRQNGAYRYCDELVATVLGFIADDEHLVQVLGGDGCTMLNGELIQLEETGIYPVSLLQFTEECWPATMAKVFSVRITDMRTVRTFAVASDGIEGQPDIQHWMQNWAQKSRTVPPNPDKLVMGLTQIGAPIRERDDITVVALSVNHAQ